MNEKGANRAVVVLACGLAGGVVSAFNCCCFPFSMLTGAVAVHWVRRTDGQTPAAGESAGLGFMSGGVSGMVAASLGTLIFLANTDSDSIAQSQELVAEITQAPVPDLNMAALAVAYGFVTFMATTVLSTLGGLAAGLAIQGKAVPDAEPQSVPAPGRSEPPLPLKTGIQDPPRHPAWQDEPTMDGPIRTGFEADGGLIDEAGPSSLSGHVAGLPNGDELTDPQPLDSNFSDPQGPGDRSAESLSPVEEADETGDDELDTETELPAVVRKDDDPEPE